ncbi:MAG: UbiD family decarboxylase, partial [Rhodospirillales bacterium]|nr:UbiD family decarboxylase [Rhodospirillales bacterium]
PDSDWVNAGTYRVEVNDKTSLCPFIETGKHGDVIRKKYWERGEDCPMVISVGQAPVLGAAAASTAPEKVSEFSIAGARIGKAIELVTGKHTGITFPADAEIVFEGFMPPPEKRSAEEGPFGEWPGYYASNSRPEPVFEIKAIYHRNNPIIVGAPPMRPVLPGFWYGTGGSPTSAQRPFGMNWKQRVCPVLKAFGPCRAEDRALFAWFPLNKCMPVTPKWRGWLLLVRGPALILGVW